MNLLSIFVSGCFNGEYDICNWPPAVSVIVLLVFFIGIFILGTYFEKHK